MPKGIKDKVVILGMGCSQFGERWDTEADDLMVEAYLEALADAGIETKQIDAAWLATEYIPPVSSQTTTRTRNWGTRVLKVRLG